MIDGHPHSFVQTVITIRSLRPASLAIVLASAAAYPQAYPSKPARIIVPFSAGGGTPPHLGAELFKVLAKIDLTHVPYKGNSAAFIDLMAGEISLMFPNIVAALPLVQQNRLHGMAGSGKKRSPIAPQIPTVTESGLPGYEMGSWFGMVAPAGTPAAVINKLQQETAKALRLPDVKDKLTAQGVDAIGGTPEEFRTFLASEIAQWARVIKASNLKLD